MSAADASYRLGSDAAVTRPNRRLDAWFATRSLHSGIRCRDPATAEIGLADNLRRHRCENDPQDNRDHHAGLAAGQE